MEIRVLKYFLAVAREGSITGAANSLHLTQPTLTRQLQELEKELRQSVMPLPWTNSSTPPKKANFVSDR